MGIGIPEVLILIIVILVFGFSYRPMMRTLGGSIKEFKQASKGIDSEHKEEKEENKKNKYYSSST